jgi:hypothetical protein
MEASHAAPAVDPGMRSAVEERQRQIDQLLPRDGDRRTGRVARGVSRQLDALETTQGLVLECLGFRTYTEFRAAVGQDDGPVVDRAALEHARREADAAERDFLEIAAIATGEHRAVG